METKKIELSLEEARYLLSRMPHSWNDGFTNEIEELKSKLYNFATNEDQHVWCENCQTYPTQFDEDNCHHCGQKFNLEE